MAEPLVWKCKPLTFLKEPFLIKTFSKPCLGLYTTYHLYRVLPGAESPAD